MSGRRRRGPAAGLHEGTRLLLAGLGLYVAVGAVVWLFPALRFTAARPAWAGAAGWLLLLASLAIWFVAARATRAAYAGGQFPTTGLFAWVRHPVYAAFIFVQCPGLILWLWAWPALVLPFAAYALSRAAARREEERLCEHFGPLYEAYRRGVPALVPRAPRKPPPGAGGGSVDRRAATRKAAAARAAARRGDKDRSDSHLRGL